MINFEWDEDKNRNNRLKHGISFELAQYAFADPKRIVSIDETHSTKDEVRYYCFGKLKDEIVTVRFTYRKESIRIFGAGYWRKGKQTYEKTNQVH